MNRCTNCILPANYPGIEFDDKGICQYCNKHKETEYIGLEALVREIEAYNKEKKDRNKDYDCMIGFSGGRDSTYLLYLLSKKLGLKVLCYSADNSYVTDEDGNEAKIVSLEYNIHSDTAKAQYWMRKPYTYNLKETLIEA